MFGKSLSHIRCLIIGSSFDGCKTVSTTLHGIGIKDILMDPNIQLAVLNIKSSKFGCILTHRLDLDTSSTVLNTVRQQCKGDAAQVPVICLTDSWDAEHITSLRDLGVTSLLSLPIDIRKLQTAITNAVYFPREFVDVPTYRGPCRRRQTVSNYAGPFRRKSDQAPALSAPKAAEQKPAAKKPIHDPVIGETTTRLPPRFTKPASKQSENPVDRQTLQTIDSAVQTISEIGDMFHAMGEAGRTIPTQSEVVVLEAKLERWLNLMSLVVARIQSYGVRGDQLDVIKQMEIAYEDNILFFANAMAAAIHRDARAVLAFEEPVPCAFINETSHRLLSLDALLDTMSEMELPKECKDNVEQAHYIFAELLDNAEAGIVLQEFTEAGTGS